jgi:hypothetical protein
MSQTDHDLIGLKELAREKREVTRLINNATDPLSVSVRRLIDAWLDSMATHSHVSPHLLERAESECGSDEELSYVLHLEALILHYSGETYQAIEKAQQCLALTSRIGHRLLEADVLIHMGQMYEALGYGDLGMEYANAAEHMRAGTFAVAGPRSPSA